MKYLINNKIDLIVICMSMLRRESSNCFDISQETRKGWSRDSGKHSHSLSLIEAF